MTVKSLNIKKILTSRQSFYRYKHQEKNFALRVVKHFISKVHEFEHWRANEHRTVSKEHRTVSLNSEDTICGLQQQKTKQENSDAREVLNAF